MNNAIWLILSLMPIGVIKKSLGSKSIRPDTAGFLYRTLENLKNLAVYTYVLYPNDRDITKELVRSIRTLSSFMSKNLEGNVRMGNTSISKKDFDDKFSKQAFDLRKKQLTNRGIDIKRLEPSFVYTLRNIEIIKEKNIPEKYKNYLIQTIERFLVIFCLILKNNGSLRSFISNLDSSYISTWTADGKRPQIYLDFKGRILNLK